MHKLSNCGIEFESECGGRGNGLKSKIKEQNSPSFSSFSFILPFLPFVLFLLQLAHEHLHLLLFGNTRVSELNKRVRNSALVSVLVSL